LADSVYLFVVRLSTVAWNASGDGLTLPGFKTEAGPKVGTLATEVRCSRYCPD